MHRFIAHLISFLRLLHIFSRLPGDILISGSINTLSVCSAVSQKKKKLGIDFAEQRIKFACNDPIVGANLYS